MTSHDGGIASTRALFDRQLAALHDSDLDRLMEQYDEEAMLVRFDLVARGRDEIRQAFAGYLARQPQLAEMKAVQITEDGVLYNAVMVIDGSLVNTYGTMVVRDGRIWRQTAVIAG